MELKNRFWTLVIALPGTLFSISLHAETVTFSNITYDEFTTNPITAGSHPSSFGFGFTYTKSGSSTFSANLSIPLVLSRNTTYGDSDDVQLGTYTTSATLSGAGPNHIASTAFSSSLTGITVPSGTTTGYYFALMSFGDTPPIIAQLPLKVGVGVALLGDYNNNGIVDAADYVIWRKTDGSPAGYKTWRANVGHTPGSGLLSPVGSVPEPASLTLVFLGLAGVLLSVRRRTGR